MSSVMTSVGYLRDSVPVIETEELSIAWSNALGVLNRLDELEIPCTMGLGSRRIIFQTIRAMKAKEILDIGTYTGTSALTMALACAPEGCVTSVDIKDVNAEDAYWKIVGRRRTPRALMKEAGISECVDFVAMDSVAFLKNTTKRFDFISIDGWHEEEAVYAEIPLAIERLNPDGLIFLDDVQPHGPPPGLDIIKGPWAAIERHLLEDAPIDVNLITRTLEGQEVALAFLTRRKS